MFDKLFEEEGMLGKGITVGKVQVCLRSPDRGARSIFGLLEDHADLNSNDNEDLARMANDVCLDLIRKSDDWVSACSSSKWFSGKDAGKAEGYYNELANDVATKFEKVREKHVLYRLDIVLLRILKYVWKYLSQLTHNIFVLF